MDELFSSQSIRAIPKVSLYLSLWIGIEILIKKNYSSKVFLNGHLNIVIFYSEFFPSQK